jgi:integrase
VNLYKRCGCPDTVKCRHPFWFLFRLERQRVRESTHTANRQLAERLAQKRRIEVLEDRRGLRKIKPVRLSKHLTAYVAHTAKTNKSAYKDEQVLDRLLASVGDRDLIDVSAFHIERWKRERAEDVSAATVNRELNIVRGCFSRAVDWGRLIVSPLRTVKPFKGVDQIRMRICSPADIKTLLEGAPDDLALLSRLTLESLLRLSEALSLRREDIGAAWGMVVQSKSGRGRRVPLTPELRTSLLARCAPSGYVFGVGSKGKPPTAASVSVAFARLARRLNLSGVSHHTLRHTGASVMVANGVSLRAVQQIGGWTSLRMVERYAHVDDAELARAVRVTHAHTEAATKTATASSASVAGAGETDSSKS